MSPTAGGWGPSQGWLLRLSGHLLAPSQEQGEPRACVLCVKRRQHVVCVQMSAVCAAPVCQRVHVLMCQRTRAHVLGSLLTGVGVCTRQRVLACKGTSVHARVSACDSSCVWREAFPAGPLFTAGSGSGYALQGRRSCGLCRGDWTAWLE